MKNSLALIMMVTFWVGCGGSAAVSPPQSQIQNTFAKTGVQLSSQENEFLNMLNALRTESGLKPLTVDPILSTTAAHHSAYMASNSVLSHDEPTPNLTSGDRIANAGGSFAYTGENIASGNTAAAETFDQWYQSPGHRENMLSDKYQFIGISGKGIYWTTDFGGN